MTRFPAFSKIFSGLATLYLTAGFALFLSVADNHYRKQGVLPLPPTIAASAFLVSVLSVVLFFDFLGARQTVGMSFLVRANSSIVGAFFCLAAFSLLFALHPEAYWGDDRKWIYLQSYDFFIFFCSMLLPASEFIRRRFRFLVIVGLLTMLGSIWYETSNPGAFSSVSGRASGFPGNSNWGALISVMICSMALGYRDGPSRMLDIILFAITGCALYFTLSRSGMINFTLLIGFYLLLAILTAKNRAQTIATLTLWTAALLSVFLLLLPLLSQSSNLQAGTKAQNRILALFDGELVDDGSSADRLQAARETLDQIESSPIIGHGTGFNRKMRQTPHNLYLKLWVDSGVFGVCTWLILLTCGFWLFSIRRYHPGQALIIVTFIGGFFSHNILEQRTFLMLFGCAASMSLFESAELVHRLSRLSRSLGAGDGSYPVAAHPQVIAQPFR